MLTNLVIEIDISEEHVGRPILSCISLQFFFVEEYVTCHTCRSPDTALERQDRLYFLRCNVCQSRCSVASIKSGFQALTGRRARIRAKEAWSILLFYLDAVYSKAPEIMKKISIKWFPWIWTGYSSYIEFAWFHSNAWLCVAVRYWHRGRLVCFLRPWDFSGWCFPFWVRRFRWETIDYSVVRIKGVWRTALLLRIPLLTAGVRVVDSTSILVRRDIYHFVRCGWSR